MVGDIKHIFVIESLGADDIKSGEELYNDVIQRRIDGQHIAGNRMTHQFYNCDSKAQLVDYLNYIAINAEYMRDGILIHFEIHGSNDKSGFILSDQSLISWNELVVCFRKININSLNQLYLSLASCYGRFLFEGVDPQLKSPYSGYISASKEVMVDEIIENFSDMFISLIQDGNLISAYLSATTEETSFFYKDSKTTFEELMIYTKDRIRNDPTYKEEIFQGALFKNALDSGIATQRDLDEIMHQAFFDIYNRHKKAFEFDQED